ncbi:extracellular solute-binding protein [Paenibacillus arenilitoris]|uniref:Extracellular solute-binding protein n=1 Tax=Paenibacillus arenilitoris TaxID=2772299 RepID=A0A927CJI8_9BACL|nr:extracellular solute-binding protein [Paenibacillus arenilitoris]MBD2867877.1 extracellular solute-binding protein [Paenibacillus arenilitoris]
MKRKMAGYTLTLALLFAFVVLPACSSGDSGNQNPNQSNASPEPSSDDTETNETENFDPLGKYDEPVTVTQVLSYRPPEEADALPGVKPETSGFVKDLKEMLNIELKYLWSVPQDQFDQKFSLSIASGDLPDVMQVDLTTFEKFREQGILADLSDAYENYASPALRKIIEKDDRFALNSLTYDGKLLGVTGSGTGGTQIVWIRKDWLDNLKLQPPATLEEFEKVAEAFVNDDPNLNGKDDTYGVILNKNLFGWGFDAKGLFYSHGSYPNAWLKSADGSLVSGNVQPETKTALSTLRSWYEKGILDKEFMLADEDKISEDIVVGKVGISFGEWWYPNWPLNLNKDNDPKAEWIPLQLPSFEGKPGKTLNQRSISSILVVHKDAKHPEAAIKMANYFLETTKPKYTDKESPDYKGASNGYIYQWYTPRFYYPGVFDLIMETVSAAVEAGQEKLELPEDFPSAGEAQAVFANAKKFQADPTDNAAWGMWYSRGARDGGVGFSKKVVDDGMVVWDEYFGPPTPTMIERRSSLDKMRDETFMKIIVGSAPVSDFDKYVEDWKKLGGDDITAEVNEWYAENANK